MNPETFPFRAIREFAPSDLVRKGNRLIAVPAKAGQDACPAHTITSYHRTRSAAERTAVSATSGGYAGILKSGRVEENS